MGINIPKQKRQQMITNKIEMTTITQHNSKKKTLKIIITTQHQHQQHNTTTTTTTLSTLQQQKQKQHQHQITMKQRTTNLINNKMMVNVIFNST